MTSRSEIWEKSKVIIDEIRQRYSHRFKPEIGYRNGSVETLTTQYPKLVKRLAIYKRNAEIRVRNAEIRRLKTEYADFISFMNRKAIGSIHEMTLGKFIEFFKNKDLSNLIRESKYEKYLLYSHADGTHRIIRTIKSIADTNFDEEVDVDNETGSDAAIQMRYAYKHHPDSIITLEWNDFPKKKREGASFNYYIKPLTKINEVVDLTRYGIFTDYDEEQKYNKIHKNPNCFKVAMLLSEIPENKYLAIEPMLRTRHIPTNQMSFIADKLKIEIELRTLRNDGESRLTRYGSKGIRTIQIGLLEQHYFLIEQTKITSYAVQNCYKLNDKKNWNEFIKAKERSKERFIDSFTMIKLFLDNKQTHLDAKTLENCDDDAYTSNPHLKEYEEPIDMEIKENKEEYSKEITMTELSEPNIFRLHNVSNYDILYFDSETTTDGNIHKPYMIRSISRDNIKRGANGQNCIIDWLNSLQNHSLCIAHNLRYDFQFIMKHLSCVSDIVMTGSRIKSISGIFHKRNGYKLILHFKDSYCLISKKLKDFAECFKLSVNKEIFPYSIYTEELITKSSSAYAKIHLDDIKSKLIAELGSKYDDFINLATKVGSIIDNQFHYMNYADYYCRQDVRVLKAGYELYRSWMLDLTKIDIDYALSNPQIAYTYGKSRGVFDGCCELSGIPRDFIQRCVVGGRCMTRNNEKFSINHDVDDFDGVSLYPSAMYRMDGLLKGLPKLWNSNVNLNNVDGYFLKIKIMSIGKRWSFPLISHYRDGVRRFEDDITIVENNIYYVDKAMLEDWIKYHKIEYMIICGYYFNEGRNNAIKEFIYELFTERLKKKAEDNPIQEVYKEIMNSFYGRLIMKEIDCQLNVFTEKTYKQKISYHFNHIKNIMKIHDSNKYLFKIEKSINNHFSFPQGGVEILSMSKRIMNEVMCLAEDNNIEIYYQDTDSMHIKKDGVQKLADLFKDEFDRELVGDNLGQFHSDFSRDYYDGDKKKKAKKGSVVSKKSIYLGKKSYCDFLEFKDEKGETRTKFHCRMKSIPNKCLTTKSVEKKTDEFGLYEMMLSGEPMKFDISSVRKFKFNSNMTTTNNLEFNRTVSF
jgi:hypothetical protein